MGNTTSAPSECYLNVEQRKLDRAGLLYATTSDIWGWKGESYSGAYKEALEKRRHKKPVMYERLEDFCRQKKAAIEAGRELGSWLLTKTTVVTQQSGAEEIEVEHRKGEQVKYFVEPLTQADRDAENKLVSILGGTNKGRGHFLPRDHCNKYWGKYAELLCGFAELDEHDEGTRETMVNVIRDFRVNLLGLDGNHDEIYDKLKTGILLTIPLVEDPYAWKAEDPYDVLVVCDSPAAYKFFSRGTEQEHTYWATEEELKLATTVLANTAKVMADSVDTHWETYYNIRGGESCSRFKLLERLKKFLRVDDVVDGQKKVRIPEIKDISNFELKFGRDHWGLLEKNNRVKLMKIDLKKLYGTEFAKYIPDPLLMALKAAANWSAFAYPRHNGKYLKFAPACADENSTDSSSPAVVSFLASEHVDELFFVRDMLRRKEAEFQGMSLNIISDDEVSSLGDEDVAP